MLTTADRAHWPHGVIGDVPGEMAMVSISQT